MSISALGQPSPYGNGIKVATLAPSIGFPASDLTVIYSQVGNVVNATYGGTVTVDFGQNTGQLTLPIPRQNPFTATDKIVFVNNILDVPQAFNYFNPDVNVAFGSQTLVTVAGIFGGAQFSGLFMLSLAYTLT
jgi:hypothetical protein